MINEIWVDIPNFEGYQVSNRGRVRSLDKYIMRKNGQRVWKKGRVLKQRPNSRGYMRVTVQNKQQIFVHRIVAKAFISNPHELPCVNHLDCNPQNNNADNLEWCTHKQNMEYSAKLGRMKLQPERKQKIIAKLSKRIMAVIVETGEKEYYESMQAAGRHWGSAGDICECIHKPWLTYKGRQWSYA